MRFPIAFMLTVSLVGVSAFAENQGGKGAAPLGAGNTSKYLGSDSWEWTVFLTGSAETLAKVREVEYTLHPTFSNPVQRVTRIGNASTPFGLTATGWGTFTVRIVVTFADGRTERLAHPLTFVPPTTPACVPDATMNQQHFARIQDPRFSRDVFVYVGDIKDAKPGQDRPVPVTAFLADANKWDDAGRLSEQGFAKRLGEGSVRAKWLLFARAAGDSIQFAYRDKQYVLSVQQLRTTFFFDRIRLRICER